MIALAVVGLFVLLPLALFALNGLVLAARTTPRLGTVTVSESDPQPPRDEVTFLSWNIAKCFAHKGGRRFDTTENVASGCGRWRP